MKVGGFFFVMGRRGDGWEGKRRGVELEMRGQTGVPASEESVDTRQAIFQPKWRMAPGAGSPSGGHRPGARR